jgi:diguanylate cyclase (GGDEF)-like protein/PAS domain S-box-containing protein
MSTELLHPAFMAAFCSSEHKALLCDCSGKILAASDALFDHSLNIKQDVTGHEFRIHSSQFNESKPWYRNLASHHREARIYGSAEIDSIGILHQLSIITIQPLQSGNELTGFKVTLEDDSLFEKSLPTTAWQQLFNESSEGMCLFDDAFKVLTANSAFKTLTSKTELKQQKISDIVHVEPDFKSWFLNAKLLSSSASIRSLDSPRQVHISITPIDLGERQVFWLTLKDATIISKQNQKLSQSFKRFRSLFDDNLNGIALVSPEGTFIEVNKQLGVLLQYDTKEIIGKTFDYFNAPGSDELSQSEATEFMNTGFSKPLQKKLVRQDGKTIKVIVQLFPNYDSNGIFTGAWNFIRLLDDDQQQLVQNAHYYEALFKSSRDAMVLSDMSGNIQLANSAFLDLIDESSDSILGKNLADLTVQEDAELEKNLYLPQLQEQGYSDIYEKRFLSPKGKELPVSVRNIAVNNRLGKPEAVWCIARDASIRRKLIQSLAVSERRFRSLFSNSFDAIGFWTVDNELQYANKAYLELVGYSQEELRSLTYLDFTPTGWEETDQIMSEQVNERGYSDVFEKEVLTKEGIRVPISIRASAMKDSDDAVIGSWVIVRDISEYKNTLRKLEHSQNMLQQTSRMSRVGGWELSTDYRSFSLTEETFQILSIPRSYHTSVKNIAKLLDTSSEQTIYNAVGDVLRGKGATTTELKLMGFSPERWIRVSAQLAFEETGQRYAYGAVQDISDFKQQQRSLETARDTFQKMAFHDPLTNLPNRLLLEDRFQQISNQAKRDHKMVALMIIDLDDFKAVNDVNGHPAGDALLVRIAEQLSSSIRSSDTVARLGGDEFVVIARLDDKDQATSLAKKILHSVEQPIQWSNTELRTACSVGIALSVRHEVLFEKLYAHADQALYEVKELGKRNFAFSDFSED